MFFKFFKDNYRALLAGCVITGFLFIPPLGLLKVLERALLQSVWVALAAAAIALTTCAFMTSVIKMVIYAVHPAAVAIESIDELSEPVHLAAYSPRILPRSRGRTISFFGELVVVPRNEKNSSVQGSAGDAEEEEEEMYEIELRSSTSRAL